MRFSFRSSSDAFVPAGRATRFRASPGVDQVLLLSVVIPVLTVRIGQANMFSRNVGGDEGASVPAAGLRDLCRPATLVLLLVPLSMLGAGTSTDGRLAAVGAIAALAALAAASVLLGIVPMRHTYLWMVLFAGLLVASFAFPVAAVPAPPGQRYRVVDLLGSWSVMPHAQLARLFDLAGILAGLALLGVTVVTSPHPRQVARVITLSGAAAAAYVLVRGGFDNVRLEGLGCNPNYLGFLLAVPFVTAVGLVRYARNPRWLVPAAVCGIALSETHSRSASLAVAVGVAIVLLQGSPRLFQIILISVVATATTAAAAGGCSGRWAGISRTSVRVAERPLI